MLTFIANQHFMKHQPTIKNKPLSSTSKKAGQPPGTLIYTGIKTSEKIEVTVFDYSSDTFEEHTITDIQELVKFKNTTTSSWINISGLHETKLIEKVGECFELDTLLLEDVLNTNHRPKVDFFENHLFFTFKMIGIHSNQKNIEYEQISFILGNGWLITFQERNGDIYNNIRERLRNKIGKLRDLGIEYLFYRMIDTTVDYYFYVSDFLSEEIQEMENRVLHQFDSKQLEEIQLLKKEINKLKRSIIPTKEAISLLEKDSESFLKKQTKRFLKDVHEHIIHLNDAVDLQRDNISSVMESYQFGVNNKTNNVMQLLTIISTIFIPLTFIAGVYGMNFENMPELSWKYSYFVIWGLMLLIFILMLIYFKRKKWL